MKSLDDRIAALEAEIEVYQLELKDASREAKLVWAGLITSRSDIFERTDRLEDCPVCSR